MPSQFQTLGFFSQRRLLLIGRLIFTLVALYVIPIARFKHAIQRNYTVRPGV